MAKKVQEQITLQEIAQELNDVMQYGVDPESGELIHPEAQIDINQKEKALLADIIKNAKEDLRPSDEDEFSEDAWNWFLDNGITPGADSEKPEDEEEVEEKPIAPKKGKAPAKAEKKSKPANDGEQKRGIKKAMVPGGNEAKAIELAKQGCSLEEFIKEFSKIYKAAGNSDKEYAARRAKIYYKIGYDRAGLALPDGNSKGKAPAKKPIAPKKGKAPAKEVQPEDDVEEAPKSRGRGRR